MSEQNIPVKQAKVISFINMKGGVGKTTLCIGLADYIANEMGKKILVIDVDPQFNSTQSFMTKYDLSERYIELLDTHSIRKIFHRPDDIYSQSKVPGKGLIYQLSTNLGLILGDINLIFDSNKTDNTKYKRIKKFIDENKLKDEYDYIFIDCPPTISMYTDAALIASDFYITPVKIDQYSILGVSSLLSVINNIAYEEDLPIKPLGIIYTHIEDSMTQKTIRLKEGLENTDKIRDLPFFLNHLSYVRDLMVGNQGNIASSYTKSKNDIKAISEELIKKLEGTQ
ncbi:Sporulation initiation inhibitor protein soj [Pasteurella canis]|uniref:Chromosome partitioning ATPase n=1 Tax=Pasteurella canis TaxID=753 RepID=A0A379EU65_9PAST|nr:AAA family ATPase [Pasteurella canis]UEC23811.1 AAA family ATPase [Pasteurella canis]GJH43103.1 chromosome partitioning ATPase [Pasteurella canis]SUC09920.1 Sporulation initiation inhibitor protein soj [Pasteurella canis]